MYSFIKASYLILLELLPHSSTRMPILKKLEKTLNQSGTICLNHTQKADASSAIIDKIIRVIAVVKAIICSAKCNNICWLMWSEINYIFLMYLYLKRSGQPYHLYCIS